MKRKRKVAGSRKAPPKRRAGPKLAVHVIIPPGLRIDGPELREFSAEQRLELAAYGARKRAGAPGWVRDESTWRKAVRAVSKHWKRFEHPWAAVAYAYARMGGTVGGGGAIAPATTRTPARRRAGFELSVERVLLDELGYDHSGRYFGTGAPLFRVSSDDPQFDTHVRAPNATAAKQRALDEHRIHQH